VAVRRVGDVDLERLHAGRHRQALLHPPRVQKLRIDLLLGGRARVLFPEEGFDLRHAFRLDAVALGLLSAEGREPRVRRCNAEAEDQGRRGKRELKGPQTRCALHLSFPFRDRVY
jgi:hypothetical protein